MFRASEKTQSVAFRGIYPDDISAEVESHLYYPDLLRSYKKIRRYFPFCQEQSSKILKVNYEPQIVGGLFCYLLYVKRFDSAYIDKEQDCADHV